MRRKTKRRKLKESVKRKIEGLGLIGLALLSLHTAGGAAFVFFLIGSVLIIGTDRKTMHKHSLIYCFAKTLVDYENEKRKSA